MTVHYSWTEKGEREDRRIIHRFKAGEKDVCPQCGTKTLGEPIFLDPPVWRTCTECKMTYTVTESKR